MVAELLYAGAEKWGKTLIVVTHDEGVAARAALRFNLEKGVLQPPDQRRREAGPGAAG
jgi:lipoprotein-releasing system ATP-binding protein